MTTNTVCDTPERCLCRDDDIADDGECVCISLNALAHRLYCGARLIVIDIDTGEETVS